MVKKPCCLFRTPHLKHKTGTDVQSASGFTIVAFEKAAIVEDMYGKTLFSSTLEAVLGAESTRRD
jgi:hypothetical protein